MSKSDDGREFDESEPSSPGPEPERLKIDGMEWDEAVRKVLKKNDPPKKNQEKGTSNGVRDVEES